MSQEFIHRYSPGLDLQESEQKMYAVHPETRNFILECIRQGTIEKTLRNSEKDLRPDIETFLRYFLGEESESELARSLRISRQALNQKLHTILHLLLHNSAPEIQGTYQDIRFIMGKDMELIYALQYAEGKAEGERSDFAIKRYRRKLREKMGFVLPTKDKKRSRVETEFLIKTLTEISADEANDQLIQIELEKIHSYPFYVKLLQVDPPVITPIRTVMKSFSGHPKWELEAIIDILNETHSNFSPIPMGTVPNGKSKTSIINFIAAVHIERALKKLEAYGKSNI